MALRNALRAMLPAAWAAVLVAAMVGGCQATFDFSGPCTADGRAAGAYPALEALVPRELGGEAATRVDSGRTCSAAALGSLASHEVSELRFAGSTWETGPNGGITIAVFEAPNGEDGPTLRDDWVHEFFRVGAEAARNTESIASSNVTVGNAPAFRLDALNGESYQSIIDWQDGDRVRVVLVGSFIRDTSKAMHETTVQKALAAAIPASK